MGNHDFHYFKFAQEKYSNYQPKYANQIQSLLHKSLDLDLFKMCHVEGNILFVHAGVTKTWCKENNIDLKNIEQSINNKFKHNPQAFRFTMGYNRNESGDDICQTPIWVRPYSLGKDKIDNWLQVVGHTTQNRLKNVGNLVFIDTLGTSGEYLQIIDGKMSSVKN